MIITLIIGSIVLCLFTIFMTIFTYAPEHIIEKENKKMVAYVYSFLQVRVEYYDYVNIFMRGNQLKIEEDYGNGGYDPFERDNVPLPKIYRYYDDNGKVIKSNW